MEYPNECVRCGFCCLIQTCSVGQRIYDGEKNRRCPAVQFDGDVATCHVLAILEDWKIPPFDIKEVMGIGKGCCIKATAYREGKSWDFASLPEEAKIMVARKMRLLARKDGGLF